MKQVRYAVLAFALITLAVAANHFLINPRRANLPFQPLQLITSLPARDLILQEVTFDIITKVTLDESGNPVLYFTTAGTFGGGTSKLILFRGCLLVRYGVQLEGLAKCDCIMTDGVLTLYLPSPQIIGEPVILTDPSCESRILDVQGEGWWAGYVQRAEIQTRIHQAYVENAGALCRSLGIEEKAKERAEQVLTALLMPVLTENNLALNIQWPDTQTENMEGALHGAMAFEMGGGNLLAHSGFLDGYTMDRFGLLVSPQKHAYAAGCARNSQFNISSKPVCGAQDDSVGTAGPGWISAK